MNRKEQESMLSEGYWSRWNPEEQARIDRDIERFRKAEGRFEVGAPAGREVKVEQVKQKFVYGAHIFNFDQLGTDERNRKYKELYGALFNSATIAFYWKTHEVEEESRDSGRSAGIRRLSGMLAKIQNVNPIGDGRQRIRWSICTFKGVRLHGHTLVWGNNTWQYPEWLMGKMPIDCFLKAKLERDPKNGRLPGDGLVPVLGDMSADEFAAFAPNSPLS